MLVRWVRIPIEMLRTLEKRYLRPVQPRARQWIGSRKIFKHGAAIGLPPVLKQLHGPLRRASGNGCPQFSRDILQGVKIEYNETFFINSKGMKIFALRQTLLVSTVPVFTLRIMPNTKKNVRRYFYQESLFAKRRSFHRFSQKPERRLKRIQRSVGFGDALFC